MKNGKPTSHKLAMAIFYMLLLLASSIIPMDRHLRGLGFIIDMKPTIQNLLHVPMYFVLSVLLLQIIPGSKFGTWKRYVLVLLIAAFFGFINEVIQIVVPGRYGGAADVMLNFVGAVAGMAFFSMAEKSKSSMLRRIVCG